jgi:NAD(P)-dependent dehydrogenase (short-subunit alcohol dehydrogenase family)
MSDTDGAGESERGLVDLDGRTAIVTGGADGIGAGVAVRLAREGANVVVADVDREGGQRVGDRLAEVGTGQFVHTDVGDEDDVAALVEATVETYGGVHVLVNNAVDGTVRRPEAFDQATFERVLSTNLAGPFLLARECYPHMRDAGYGRIVNVGAIQATSPLAGAAAYATSKAGLEGLTRSLAMEWSAEGVTVNTVKVGVVFTREQAGADWDPDVPVERRYEDPPAAVDREAATLVGRVGTPGDVAGLVAYLAGPESGFVTGATLRIDGGRLISRKPEPIEQLDEE